jgi:hypothetical protein
MLLAMQQHLYERKAAMSRIQKQPRRRSGRTRLFRVETLERRAVLGVPWAWLAFELNTHLAETSQSSDEHRASNREMLQEDHTLGDASGTRSQLDHNRDPPVRAARGPPEPLGATKKTTVMVRCVI